MSVLNCWIIIGSQLIASLADVLSRLNRLRERGVGDHAQRRVIVGTARHDLARLFELALAIVGELEAGSTASDRRSSSGRTSTRRSRTLTAATRSCGTERKGER